MAECFSSSASFCTTREVEGTPGTRATYGSPCSSGRSVSLVLVRPKASTLTGVLQVGGASRSCLQILDDGVSLSSTELNLAVDFAPQESGAGRMISRFGEGLKLAALAMVQQPDGCAFIFARQGSERTVLALWRGAAGDRSIVRDTLVLPPG